MQDFRHLTDTVSAGTEGKDMIFFFLGKKKKKRVGLTQQKMEEGGDLLTYNLKLSVLFVDIVNHEAADQT